MDTLGDVKMYIQKEVHILSTELDRFHSMNTPRNPTPGSGSLYSPEATADLTSST